MGYETIGASSAEEVKYRTGQGTNVSLYEIIVKRRRELALKGR